MTGPLPLGNIPETYLPLQTIRSRWNEIFLYSLVGLLVFAPLAFGAAELWAGTVLEISAAALVLVWAMRQVKSGTIGVSGNPVFAPMLAFGGVGLRQFAAGPPNTLPVTSSAS